MPVYSNLNRNNNGYGNGTGMPGAPNTAWGNGYDAMGMPQQTAYTPAQQPMPPQQTHPGDARLFVNGRAAADVYPMPQGVHVLPLWDISGKRLYIKAYDNNGFPCVIEDLDVTPHVEPDPPQYVTKDDIREVLEQLLGERSLPDMKNYVTRNEMNKALSRTNGDKRRGDE